MNKLKNLTIGKKLRAGFSIVLALMILSSLLSLISITTIGNQVELYGQYTVPNNTYLTNIRVNMQNVLFNLLEAITEEDPGYVKAALDDADVKAKIVAENLEAFKSNRRDNSDAEELERLTIAISDSAAIRKQIVELTLTDSKEDRGKALRMFWDEYRPTLNVAIDILNEYDVIANEQATKQNSTSAFIMNISWFILLGCGIASIVLTIFVIKTTTRSILNPVDEIMKLYEEVAKGNMNEEIKYESSDEMGQLAKLIQKSNEMMSDILKDVSEKFNRIADGDLSVTVDMEYPGDFKILKETISNTVSTLNQTMHIINATAEQVSEGSDQVSDAAQSLAAGSTQQAASIQELSDSIEKISHQSSENLAIIDTVSNSVKQTSNAVNDGNAQMMQLTNAMENIGSSSNQIADITRAIESIASQTNLLALNAAIEAARAGDAGKGFAVVAEEVRDLAAKSAEAAQQTGELIEASVSDVSKGMQITKQMDVILKNVMKSTGEVTEEFVKIEQASIEQADAIEQIKTGLSHISAVVQNNAATAEENSATSEEMSSQAMMLREEVSRFKLN